MKGSVKKLWSSDEEEEEEFSLKDDDDVPRYADHVIYITCFILFDFALFTSYFGSFVSMRGAFCSVFMLVNHQS